MTAIDSTDLTLSAEDASGGPYTEDTQTENVTPAGGATGDASTAAAADGSTDAATKTDDWRALLDGVNDPTELLQRVARSVSREDLLRDPTLAGIIGDTADKLERKRAAEREQLDKDRLAREAADAAQRELEALAEEDDLLSLGEKTKEQVLAAREARKKTAEQTARAQEAGVLFQDISQRALNSFVDQHVPAPVRTKLAELVATGKYGELEYEKGFGVWLNDLVAANVDHARSEWEKSTRAAIRQEVLGEIESGDDTPEIGAGGAPATAGLITQAEWNANKTDRAWRMTNLERIGRSIAAGRITE